MRSICFLAALGLGAIASCTSEPDDAFDELDDDGQEIVAGHEVAPGTTIARANVMFAPRSSGGAHGCSATILDAAHALTAAHCTIGFESVPDPVLVFATRFADDAPMRPVTGFVTPSSNPADDIAVLTFSGGLPPNARGVVLAPNLVLAPHDRLIHVGYGQTTPTVNDRGVLRRGNAVIDSVQASAGRYRADAAPATICSGDSGGPDYVRVGGLLRQIGVHVGGDCATFASSTDVGIWVNWIRSTGAHPRVDVHAVAVD